jgi:quinol monooxygenase YgiN
MSERTAFVVIAEFVARPERMDDFLVECRADAASSVGLEPGCRSFNAVVPDDAPDHVVLYEVYDNAAAFAAHKATAHYARFAQAVAEMTVGTPVVRSCTRVG